jgi:hypothetical protein
MSFTAKPVQCNGLNEFATQVWVQIIKRWAELDCNYDNWTNAQGGICNERVRELGEQVYRQTNSTGALIDVSQYVYSRLQGLDEQLAACFITDINWAWKGIGDWQA